MKGMFAQRED